MINNPLKKCPFCGKEALIYFPDAYRYYPGCNTSIWCPGNWRKHPHDSKEHAILEWNRRNGKEEKDE